MTKWLKRLLLLVFLTPHVLPYMLPIIAITARSFS